MNIDDMANAWARSERNTANRGKHVNQKGWVTLEQMRKNAAEKKAVIAILLLILIAICYILAFLIKGLFSKNKFIKIFSALGLLAFVIGTTILIRYVISNRTSNTPMVQNHQHEGDALPRSERTPKTPMEQYLKMDEQSFRTQCASFLDSAKQESITPSVRTNLATILVFRDKIHALGVSDEAFKKSYESGGFEGLFHEDVMKHVASSDHNVGHYSLSDLKTALDKCLAHIEAPDWKQQELKIRTCLYGYLGENKNLLDSIIRSANGDGDSKEAAMRYLEAMEIVRVLKSLKMMGRINLKTDQEAPSSSGDCANKIVKECGCQGIVEKWVLEIGKWCVAWDLPDDAPNSITFLVSPGFSYDAIVSGHRVGDSITSTHPYVLVHKDGEIRDISIEQQPSLRGIFDNKRLCKNLSQLKYLTPQGILTPFATGQVSAHEHAEVKSKDAEARSVTAPKGNGVLPNQPDDSTKSQSQKTVQPNPHFETARKHDWQSKYQKEWGKSFSEVQRTFSVFGGFQLAQPPIDNIDFAESGNRDSGNSQKNVPLLKQYRYFQKADLEFFNGALVGFTLKAHFAKTYSKASIDREYKAFQEDVIKNLQSLNKPELGVGVGTTSLWTVRYGESRRPSIHKITGRIYVTHHLRQNDDGYDLTMTVDAKRGLGHYIELVLKKESDEKGDELEEFNKKQQAKDDSSKRDDGGPAPAERTSRTVKITGLRGYKFGQKYPATRMTAEMWQEGELAIRPVQTRYRKFRTLELGYAIDGKQLCRMRLCAEFPRNTDDSLLSKEFMTVKGEIEHQFGLEMTERGNEAHYEDENYVVKLWYQSTAKTVYNTRHVGFRNQRVASTVNIKGLYLLIEDKNLMP